MPIHVAEELQRALAASVPEIIDGELLSSALAGRNLREEVYRILVGWED